MIFADLNPTTGPTDGTTQVFQTRQAFFDIYTQPGSVYEPMDVQVSGYEGPNWFGDETLASSICRIEIYYVGIYSTCVQAAYVNNMANGQMTTFRM